MYGFLTFLLLTFLAFPTTPSTAQYSLVAVRRFFFATGGATTWTKNTSWLDTSVPVCAWYGIVCNKESEVTELRLSGNNLTGNVYTTNITLDMFSPSRLRLIDLSMNKLEGTLLPAVVDAIPSSLAVLNKAPATETLPGR